MVRPINGVYAVETTLKFFYYCLTSDAIKMTVNTIVFTVIFIAK